MRCVSVSLLVLREILHKTNPSLSHAHSSHSVVEPLDHCGNKEYHRKIILIRSDLY